MADYSKMTTEDFDRILFEIASNYTVSDILTLPGIYDILSEYFNNEVLERWAEEQPEPDDDEEEDDEDAAQAEPPVT